MLRQVVTHALHHLDQFHQLANQDFSQKYSGFYVAAFSDATTPEAKTSLASETALASKEISRCLLTCPLTCRLFSFTVSWTRLPTTMQHYHLNFIAHN